MTRFSSYHIFRENLNKKEARAVEALQAIFEAASRFDDRSHPPQPLVRKHRFEIPAGSVFSFDEDVLRELFEEGCAKERGQSQSIGSITMDGRTHEFSFFDLVLIGGTQTRDWRRDLGQDPVQARLELLMRMYSLRHRFEEFE